MRIAHVNLVRFSGILLGSSLIRAPLAARRLRRPQTTFAPEPTPGRDAPRFDNKKLHRADSVAARPHRESRHTPGAVAPPGRHAPARWNAAGPPAYGVVAGVVAGGVAAATAAAAGAPAARALVMEARREREYGSR